MKKRLITILSTVMIPVMLAGCMAQSGEAILSSSSPSVTSSASTETTLPALTPPDNSHTTTSATTNTTTAVTGTTTNTPEPPSDPLPDLDVLIGKLSASLDAADAPETLSADFLYWLCDTFGEELLTELGASLVQDGYSNGMWFDITGNTLAVLFDLYTGAAENDDRIVFLSMGRPGCLESTDMIFGGDICFADNYRTMEYMQKNGLSITDCIDPLLIDEMKGADIAFMNNEFTISDRGTPMENKAYTFRAATKNTALYNTLGIDIVSLANNHAYDYGKDAFLDTLDALDAHNIASIGGGANLEYAMKPMYYLVNGRKIAFVAATRAEKYKLTPQATETTPGVLRCYDTTLFLEVIREAEANSDFVVACIHWGTEYSAVLQDVQRQTARDYIDAGVDLIIGAHAHQLQGVEFYKGKAIFYNLGNFWFNAYEIDTGLVKVQLLPDGSTVSTFIPALQKDCHTTMQAGTEKGSSILEWMEEHSIGAVFGKDGVVSDDSENNG